MRKWKPVRDFDSDSQSADDPWDPAKRLQTKDGVFVTGRGAQGGGSKKTHQAVQMTTGSGSRSARYTIPTSNPKTTQKIRG